MIEHLPARRQAIVGMPEGALDHQDVGVRQFGLLGGGRLAQLEVAGVQERLLAVFGQQHGRAEAVAGRKGRQPQPAPFDRLSIGHRQRRPRTEPVLIQGGRLGRTQGVLVPGDVVAMGVRDERPRLTPAKVDRQVGLGQLQSVIPVEHGRGQGSEDSGEWETRRRGDWETLDTPALSAVSHSPRSHPLSSSLSGGHRRCGRRRQRRPHARPCPAPRWSA